MTSKNLMAMLSRASISLETKDFVGDQDMIGITSAHMTGHLNKLLELINDENATLGDIRHQARCYKASQEMLLELIK